MTNKYDDFHLPGVTEQGACNGVFIMDTSCVVCREVIAGPCVALGKPYWCLLHPNCWPHFPFNGHYPHSAAVAILAKKNLSDQ